jgi:hypothetical protein
MFVCCWEKVSAIADGVGRGAALPARVRATRRAPSANPLRSSQGKGLRGMFMASSQNDLRMRVERCQYRFHPAENVTGRRRKGIENCGQSGGLLQNLRVWI